MQSPVPCVPTRCTKVNFHFRDSRALTRKNPIPPRGKHEGEAAREIHYLDITERTFAAEMFFHVVNNSFVCAFMYADAIKEINIAASTPSCIF